MFESSIRLPSGRIRATYIIYFNYKRTRAKLELYIYSESSRIINRHFRPSRKTAAAALTSFFLFAQKNSSINIYEGEIFGRPRASVI